MLCFCFDISASLSWIVYRNRMIFFLSGLDGATTSTWVINPLPWLVAEATPFPSFLYSLQSSQNSYKQRQHPTKRDIPLEWIVTFYFFFFFSIPLLYYHWLTLVSDGDFKARHNLTTNNNNRSSSSNSSRASLFSTIYGRGFYISSTIVKKKKKKSRNLKERSTNQVFLSN